MKRNVAVLMGGMSTEHDVSLNSGRGVTTALEGDDYHPIPIVIARDGAWQFPDSTPLSIYDAVPRLRDLNLACVFIALHGAFGEDGRLQGLLDTLGIPYTGSGCAASALAMDKVRCKAVVQMEDIRTASHVAFGRLSWALDADPILEGVKFDIGLPCVVKPVCQGSSVGVAIPQTLEEVRGAVEEALRIDDFVMIEEFISGVEVTCSVLDAEPDGRIRALPVTEICPKSSTFFDYRAKYTPGASEEITPARISRKKTELIQKIAVHVHHLVGCKGWSRSDFMIDDDGPVWIEVNTVPGLTQTSLFPQACAAAGISYEQMCRLFVEAAIREGNRT